MEIHNLLEDKVRTTVSEYCGSPSFDREKYCDCIQCRLDVICYVLNLLMPMYIVSSRGIVHHEIDYSKKVQQEADIFKLVKDGFTVIADRKRPDIDHSKRFEKFHREGSYFNFPNIIGKIINGKTFEPVENAEVKLLMDDSLVDMTSDMTKNPVHLTKYTSGLFIFWPYPLEAEKTGEARIFTFKITAAHPDFDEYIKLIDVEVTSSENFQDSIHLQNTMNIDEIYLFPKVDNNYPMDN